MMLTIDSIIYQMFIDELPWALEETAPHVRAAKMFAWIFYLQPFPDGNKRTAHLIANALLIQENHGYIDFDANDVFDLDIFNEAREFFRALKTKTPDCSLLMQRIASQVK